MDKLQPIAALGVAPIVEATYPEPFKSRMGRFQCRLLGDEFGLTVTLAARMWRTRMAPPIATGQC